MPENDEFFMSEALAEAGKAGEAGETPVGAVLVRDGKILARAGNRRETDKLATAHAEMLCIEEASKKLGGWRLPGCTLYVTLEPCPMCAGAILAARIDHVVFALKDAKSGAFGSVVNLAFYPFNHKPQLSDGILCCESRKLLADFFAARRRKNEPETSDMHSKFCDDRES